jgi:hypothetical protein
MRSIALLGCVLVGSLAIAIAPVSCGSNQPGFEGPDSSALDEGGDDVGDPFNHDSATDAQDSLTVTPAGVVLNATGSPVTQAYVATLASTASPVMATWAIGNPAMGGIDQNGLFTANGNVGGVTDVDANYGAAAGTTTVTVNVSLTENPGGVSGATQTLLKAGGSADSGFKWLYPYDATVFPRGLTPPTMQFGGTAADATYVHITAAHLTYDGFFGAANPTNIDLSAATWKNVTESAGASDPLKVQVTKISGGQVTGPITESWPIAQANLHGTVYYDTYTSLLASGGATLKIKVGQPAAVLVGNCNTCHSVSANGNVLAASYGHSSDYTYDLTKPGIPPPHLLTVSGGLPDPAFEFPALYPDGTLSLTTYADHIPGMGSTNPPTLYDTKTGNVVPSTGISGIMASMPAFSPDGKMVVFNHEDTTNGHTLGVMAFDVKTKIFSKLVDVATDSTYYLSWPQFTPDALKVIYGLNTNTDYSSWGGEHANLAETDVATKKPTNLDMLNGTKGSGTYLPYGSAEQNLNYEPTVLPLAVGGYYWVVFTSRRFYGNIMNPTNYPDAWSNKERKKLWVAAIDINPAPGKDASHPAFYLPGQEFEAGNMRGFWALDPCKTNGITCETSDECCGGYCRQVTLSDGGLGRQCVPPPGGCSNEFEVCKTASDCCNGSNICVGGRCSQPPPN